MMNHFGKPLLAKKRAPLALLLIAFVAGPVALFFLTLPARAQNSESPPAADDLFAAVAKLAPRYQQWVQSVLGLMTRAELEYFVNLEEDYRRDAFMDAFWRPRDPDPQTDENELRERWEEYRRQASGFPYGDPRFVVYLLNGPPGGWSLPDGRPVARCFSRSRELEIWFYEPSPVTGRRLPLIFLRRVSEKPYEIYLPGDQLRAVPRSGSLPTAEIRLLCADELLNYAVSEIRRVNGYDRQVRMATTPPLPSAEWLANLSASATDLPADVPTFDVETTISFPERNQSRTGVRTILTVPREEAAGRSFDGRLFHDFTVQGEVIRDGSLFESFRYRFEGPTPEGATAIPLGFTRYLRPGPARLRILVHDVYGDAYAQVEREIEVPSPEGLPAVEDPLAAIERPTGPSLTLLPPPGSVHAGQQRFRARAFGEIDKVTFYVDGEPKLSKRTPPFSVELDLGEDPAPHRVRVAGFAGDEVVASDQIWLNQGAQRFRVRLVEPQPGGIYPGHVTARVAVEAPGEETTATVELFVNDELRATLDAAPYARSLELPADAPAVVRAVARLADGTSAEDAVLVNSSAFTEEVEVRLVEVPVLVLDAEGDPLTGLSAEDFRVFDAGEEVALARFAMAEETPRTTALLLDRSASMAEEIGAVSDAALALARAASRDDGDRVAVFSFADRFSVDADFTPELAPLERALAGQVAQGSTALWDAVAQGLNALAEESGTGTLVLFSDGQDESSQLGLESVREAARRTGVTLYTVGLLASFPDRAARRWLEELSTETGGRAIFLDDLAALPGAFEEILSEVGARYVLAFEPPAAAEGEFREIRVEVDVPGARVVARRGWVP